MKRTLMVNVIYLIMVSTFVGCATATSDLVRTGRFRLEQTVRGKIRAMWFSASEQNNVLEVRGVLKRDDRVGMAIKAHVDITLIAPDGKILASKRSQDLYVRHNRVGAGPQRWRRFSVVFDVMPPDGSVIQVIVDTKPHK